MADLHRLLDGLLDAVDFDADGVDGDAGDLSDLPVAETFEEERDDQGGLGGEGGGGGGAAGRPCCSGFWWGVAERSGTSVSSSEGRRLRRCMSAVFTAIR